MNAEEQEAQMDIDRTMKKLRTGKIKLEQQTRKGPTKEEAHKNFMLGIIDEGYEEE